MSWEIRTLEQDQEDEVNELFNRVFKLNRSDSEWRWKYRDNPISEVFVVSVAVEESGKIIGQYANVPSRFHMKGIGDVSAVQPVDNMIAPEHRQGLGKARMQRKMHQHATDRSRDLGVAFGFGFPNPEALRVGKKMLKLQVLTELRMATFPITRLEYDHLHSEDSSFSRMLGYRKWKRDLNEKLKRKTNSALWEGPASEFSGEEIRGLWLRCKDQFPIAQIRDSDYFQWRFKDHPTVAYRVSAIRGDEGLNGVLIYRTSDDGSRVLLVDLLGEPDSQGWSVLLASAVEWAQKEGLGLVQCWNSLCNPYWSGLESFGFLEAGDPIPVFLQQVREDLNSDFLFDPQNWYFTMADSDGI